MAKVVQDNVLVSVSKIARDDAPEGGFVTDEQKATIEALVAEILGEGFVVEVIN